MKKILVTPRSLSKSGHPALKTLEDKGFEILMPWPARQPNPIELEQVLPSCCGYLAGVEPISAKVIAESVDLKVISRNGVGLDNVDLEAASRAGIQVLGTPGANSQGVAELALALMLCQCRSIASSSSILKAGDWKRSKGIEIQRRTLGIIGCGQIGYRLAKMALGIGMHVIGYDLYPSQTLRDLPGFSFVTISEIQKYADVISLHCPPSEKPLVDTGFLELCKDGVIIVNTARASLIDENAMLEAIESGKVNGYATDVYIHEPPEVSLLYGHEKVTMTPHIGGFTDESVDRATVYAVENLINVLC